MIDMLHSNAILKSFIEILETELKNTNNIDHKDDIEKHKKRKYARFRWFLAYTLINNEELRLNRAHAKRLRLKQEKLEEMLRLKEEKASKKQERIDRLKLAIRPRSSSQLKSAKATPKSSKKENKVAPDSIELEKYTML